MTSETVDASSSTSSSSGSHAFLWKKALFGAVIAIVTAFYLGTKVPRRSLSLDEASPNSGDLLTAHKLLSHTLAKEAQLKFLHILRKATFRKHEQELERLMVVIYKTSAQRNKELQNYYWALDPPIDLSLAPESKVGDAIQYQAETKGTLEMTMPNLLSQFDARFYFLQSQATRMIAAIAKAGADIETNTERKKFLLDMVNEYESLRDELVRAVTTAIECEDSYEES